MHKLLSLPSRLLISAGLIAGAAGLNAHPTENAGYTYTVIALWPSTVSVLSPSVNSGGQVAFIAAPNVYRGDGEQLTTIYARSVALDQPGAGTGWGHVSINDNGMVAFGTGGFLGGARIVAGDGSSTQIIAATLSSPWADVVEPSINSLGDVAFQARDKLSLVNRIVLASGGAFSPVVGPGADVPGGTVTSAYAPRLQNDGAVAFTAGISKGPGSNVLGGIYRLTEGVFTHIAVEGSAFGINEAGRAAFFSSATQGSIMTGDGGPLSLIAPRSTGFSPAPHRVSINDSGNVAFLVGDGSGGGSSVFAGDGDAMWPVVRVGDSIPGVGTVLDASISNEAINNSGQVAFLARYTDGTGGSPKWAIVRADPISTDNDDDGIADDADPDDDNDGQTDADETSCGSNPLDRASRSADFDGDARPDCADPDDDNDGVSDIEDAFSLDPAEWRDSDGDRIGDNADTDDDNDGQTDADEGACGSNPIDRTSRSADFDGDGRPDCVDADDDNDGVRDGDDVFPFDPRESRDRDGDGIGDNADDHAAPDINRLTLSTPVLWPPNHKMVSVAISVGVTDAMDAHPQCLIRSVSSNEPDSGLGGGDVPGDSVITAALRVDLPAERSGRGTGRVYTISVECSDASGNRSIAAVGVTVPHDQKK
jgi:hypothetical protein